MNDYSGHGYDGWSTGVAYGADDPLFGALPGDGDTDAGAGTATTTATGTATFAETVDQAHPGGHDSWQWQWQGYDTGQTQVWDNGVFTTYGDTALFQQVPADSGAPDETQVFESYGSDTYSSDSYSSDAYSAEAYSSDTYSSDTYAPDVYMSESDLTAADLAADSAAESEAVAEEPADDGAGEAPAPAVTRVGAPRSRAAGRGGSGSRRRRPAKRSPLMTVAVPSMAVMGVAACGAAAVAVTDDKDESTSTQAEDTAATSAVTTKLDQQLAGVSRNADEFADRASRTQERIDLKERQEAEKRKKAAEAARKEALRPKFFLPVTQEGLSAYFGQAGVNWMSVHTGIDFPVSYGTTVRSVTDGTVRTQWNSAYGNMAIVTAPDGTETWYCHLSSTKIRSGSVKAGDVIAYSGNSGNSTGPHLHLEVHPDGGAAVDPLSWLLSKGLDPR